MLLEYEGSGKNIKGDYVLSICRLNKKKNCEMIVKSLSILDTKLKYIAVGRDSGNATEIKELCEENDIPFEHKPLVTEKEKFELIKKCNMLIYPQNTEYIGGLSPFEGMYVGKPVLTGNFKILKDLYKDVPFYFEMGVRDLAKNIAFVNSIDREKIQNTLNNGIKLTKETVTFKLMAERLLNVFKYMVKGK